MWEKADENWRRGIEGINAQLNNILAQHQVTTVSPLGEVLIRDNTKPCQPLRQMIKPT